MALGAAVGAVSASVVPDFEISSEVLLAGSPAAMLFAFIDTQDDFSGAEQALTVLPSVCKTAGLEHSLSKTMENRVDCDLTGVDAECFLTNLAGQVGKSWGTQELDQLKAQEVIEKRLKKEKLTLQAAAVACSAAPLVIPLLRQFGTEMDPVSDVISQAKSACTRK